MIGKEGEETRSSDWGWRWRPVGEGRFFFHKEWHSGRNGQATWDPPPDLLPTTQPGHQEASLLAASTLSFLQVLAPSRRDHAPWRVTVIPSPGRSTQSPLLSPSQFPELGTSRLLAGCTGRAGPGARAPISPRSVPPRL